MRKQVVEKISEYIEENNLEVSSSFDIDSLDNAYKDNLIKLADEYTKYFEEFSKLFKNCQDKEIRRIFSRKDLFLKLLKLKNNINININYANGLFERKIRTCVLDNYSEIVDFVEMVKEIKDETNP